MLSIILRRQVGIQLLRNFTIYFELSVRKEKRREMAESQAVHVYGVGFLCSYYCRSYRHQIESPMYLLLVCAPGGVVSP